MNPTPQEAAAQSTEHRGRHIGTHDNIQTLGGKGFCQVSGQAGCQRGDEHALKKARCDEDPEIVRQGANQTAGSDCNAAC